MSLLIVNDKKKLMFIPMLKNGCMYSSNILTKYYEFENKYGNLHKKYNHDNNMINFQFIKRGYKIAIDEIYMDYTCFAFIRNPYSRFISGYLNFGLNLMNIKNIDDCILKQNEMLETNYRAYLHIFVSQFLTLNGILNKVDLLRFEHLNDDLNKYLLDHDYSIVKHEDIPINVTSNKNNECKDKPFYLYYTQSSLNFINKWFIDDFNNYGYPMFDNIEDLQQNYEYNI